MPVGTWFTEGDITEGNRNKIYCWESLCRYVRMNQVRIVDKAHLVTDEYRLHFCWKEEEQSRTSSDGTSLRENGMHL